MPAAPSRFDTPVQIFIACLAATLLARLVVLVASPLELQFDEAQYWFWSLTPSWGYFSKPPLIAWAIATTTRLFGDAEWAVRLTAPFAQAGGAVALFALARALYTPWAGLWAGLGWLWLPAVWLSSAVMSTDALVLPLWSLALFALARLIATRTWPWAIVLGFALGLGGLAKYAMLYFVPCAALAALWSKDARRALLSTRGLAAGAVALACLAPNLLWNATHHFATLEHTASNSGWERLGLHPDEMVEFIGGQALVAGPILFGALVWLLWRASRAPSALDDRDRLLLAFGLPPLLVMLAQALASHAHANWAATAYPALVVWIAGRLAGARWGARVLAAAAALHLMLGAYISAAALSPTFANAAGLGNSLEDSRGWRAIAQETAVRANAAAPLTAVAVDHRALFFELTYYWRRDGVAPPAPLRMWMLHADPRNHAEAVAPLTPAEGGRVFAAQMQQRYAPLVAADFTQFASLARTTFQLGGGQARTVDFSLGEGFRPRPRDAAFEARLGRR